MKKLKYLEMLISLAKRTEKPQSHIKKCFTSVLLILVVIHYLKSRQLDQIQAPFVLLTSAFCVSSRNLFLNSNILFESYGFVQIQILDLRHGNRTKALRNCHSATFRYKYCKKSLLLTFYLIINT